MAFEYEAFILTTGFQIIGIKRRKLP